MAKSEKYSRIIIKRSNISGVVPTIPLTGVTSYNDHTLSPAWRTSDLYVGEFFLNQIDERLWIRDNETNIKELLFTDGIILTDRTTSTRYRLYVDNGVLGIEAV